jgi:hypothetical protein
MSELTADTMHSAARGLELAVSMIRNGDMPQASAIANVARLCDEAGQTITRLRAELADMTIDRDLWEQSAS